MNNPEESAVRDLDRFTTNVLNGCLDLHMSAAELIRYAFNVRTVKDVIRRGSENPELINQISDQINHLVIYLNEEIVETAARATPVGMEDRHFIELQKRMQLMYEVWLGMKINEAYQVRQLTEHVEASKEAVKHTYEICKDYYRWKTLPGELREFFLDEKEEVKSVVDEVEPTLFAREDGVVSSLAHEKAQSDEEGKKKQFVAKTEKVLNNYRAKNPDYRTMRELISSNTKFRLEGIYCDHLINEFISVWDMAIDQAVKPEEKYAFTALLKKVFLMMVDYRRNDLACKLFDKYEKDAIDVLPCLENYVENFNAGLTEAINQLPLDSNVLSNNLELFEKAKDPIMWYLLVSPAYTVQQLLTICIDNKGYIPLVGRILRVMPTLFERSVNITPLPFEEVRKEKVLVTILHRIVMIGRTTWTSASQWDNAGQMIMSLAKERKRKEGQAERMEDKALLDSFTLISFALTELPKENRKPQKAVETFVKMLQRLLANNNNSRMLTNYRLATSFDDEGENVLATPIILHLMYELLVEYDGQSIEVCDGARDILKSISGRMNNDGITFDNDTCKYLTDENFNAAPWWIKYSVYTWFSSALRAPRRQVPSGVYKMIPDQHLDDFEHIRSEEMSVVSDCYLRSLFELGLFDVDIAIDLLQYGYGAKFEESVIEKMALALVDSYGKKMSKRSGKLDIGRLIIAMLKAFDPIRELAPLKTYCTCYLESVTKIEHILILFMAARIAKEKQLSAARVRTEEIRQTAYDDLLSLNDVADQLMDVFCETTKAHIEKEASEVEKIRREADALIFTPGNRPEQFKAMIEKDEREQSLALQLTMIYLKCSHFCRLYQQVPIKLQQLMNSTLEKQFDSQKLLAKKVMDDVLTDQRKTEVVYAFVDVPVEQKNPEKDVIEPVKPSELFASKQSQSHTSANESVSAENAMFGFNGEENRHGRGFHSGYRGNDRKPYEQDRPTSSRSGGRNDRNNSYRGNRWNPVNDMQTFGPKNRDTVYKSAKAPSNNDYAASRSDSSKQAYDPEKLYYDDRRSPFKPQGCKTSDDVRRYSESKDTSYDNSSWENQSRRWPSESEYSHEDSENRLLDQSVRSVHNFSHREHQQHTTRPGTSSTSPPKAQEGKQQKKGFGGGESNRGHGNTRKTFDRKPRYSSSHYHEQEEEMKNRLKPGRPEREELAQAMGFSDRSPNPPKSRRGAFNQH